MKVVKFDVVDNVDILCAFVYIIAVNRLYIYIRNDDLYKSTLIARIFLTRHNKSFHFYIRISTILLRFVENISSISPRSQSLIPTIHVN